MKPTPTSARVLRAVAPFGIGAACAERDARARAAHARYAARALDRALGRGHVAFITGPSGGGKSTLLRALALRLRARGERVVWADPSRLCAGARPLVDRVPGPLPAALGHLARAGLAEARLWPRSVRALSEGERARAALARSMALCERAGAATLLADEFCSGLDRATACSVAAALARWARGTGGRRSVRVVVASAHDDLLEALDPRLLVYVGLPGEAAQLERAA